MPAAPKHSLTVRRGSVLVHCNTVAEAAQIARELDLTLATVPDHVDSIGQILQQSTISEEADAACSFLLGRVTEACPHIDGKAAQNFGTLFRVADFREICAGQLVRDVDLMRVLQHVAAASDAKRHLTATRVQEAVSLVLKLLETRSHMSPPPPPPQDFEGVYDTTSEAECSDVSLPSSATSHCVTQQLGFADCTALPGAPATSRSTSHTYGAVASRMVYQPGRVDDPPMHGIDDKNQEAVEKDDSKPFLCHEDIDEQIDKVLAFLTEEPIFHKRPPTTPTTQAASPPLHLSKLRPADRVWADMEDDDAPLWFPSCPHLHSGYSLVDTASQGLTDFARLPCQQAFGAKAISDATMPGTNEKWMRPCKPCMGKGKGNGEICRKQLVTSDAVKFKMVLKKYGHKIVQLDEFLSEYRARRRLE
jgi:hypothetical protein